MNSSNFNSSRKHQTTHSVPFTPKKKRLDPFSTAAIDLNENKNNSSAQELNIAREFALLVRQHGNDPFAHADRFASMTTRGERDTWMLLLGLNKDRIDVAMRRMRALDNGGAADVSAQSCERLDVVESALANDDSLRELDIVVRWLEQIHDAAAAPPAPLQSAWLDTARAVADRRLDDHDDYDGAVQLDPDAPIRALHGVQLEPSDADDERRLLAELWRLVRGGRLDAARRLCRDADQAWRAAVLAGDELSLDKRRRGLAVAVRAGNWSRYAWKSACLALAHADVASVHERAVHGVLCGSLRAMLLCCNTYDDYLWAHLRAAHDRRLDDALASQPDIDVDADGANWRRRYRPRAR
jgi:hypothetical protein